MKETMVELMAASAVLLSPDPAERPVVTDTASQIETLADATNESLPSPHAAPSEVPEPEPTDGPAHYDIDMLHTPDVALLSPSSERHDVALPPEMLDPNNLLFWIEAGAAGLGLTGGTTIFTRRQLRKSLRANHAVIQGEGIDAQQALDSVLKAAQQQADGLRDDDVDKLRELIRKHSVTSTQLFDALAGTGTEFDAELEKFFPLKSRLHSAPNVATVLKMTKSAITHAKALQAELDRVKTDLAEIDTNIGNAGTAVADVHGDLTALVEKGWDISKYQERATSLTTDMEDAQMKRAQNYVDAPTNIARTVIEEAAKLKEKVAALEPRRAAADEVYGTQAGRAAEATAITIAAQSRATKLRGAYSESCLVDFENVEDKLTATLTTLTSAYETGGTLVGEQGKSIDAVKRSEKLNETFDKALEEIKAIDNNLQQREEHLATLVEDLPDQIDKLNARFDRAMMLVGDPDIEDDAAVNIRSLTNAITKLSNSIDTEGGDRPDYLDIEKRHQKLAEQLAQAHDTAAQQKQEMNDLRNEVPQLKDGYNGLIKVIRDFAKKERVSDATKSDIRKLQAYKYDIATDRKNLRQQRRKLEEALRHIHEVLEQAEADAGGDSTLLKTAKIAGGVALAVIGIDLLD